MTYPDISTINISTDPTGLFVYANTITNGAFMPFVLLAFFIIVTLGSYFSQIRFTGRGRIDFSFAAAGFVTAIFATLMSMKNGLLAPMYVIIAWIIAIVGVAYLYMSSQDQ